MTDFSRNLAKLRAEMQMTQEELAKRVGVSQSAIWQYENGIATPKIDIAVRLAKCLGTTAEMLAKGGDCSDRT